MRKFLASFLAALVLALIMIITPTVSAGYPPCRICSVASADAQSARAGDICTDRASGLFAWIRNALISMGAIRQ